MRTVKPRVKIGSAYERRHYVMRTPLEYRALRPVLDSDASRVQRAMLASAQRPQRGSVLTMLVAAVCVLAIGMVMVSAGDPLPAQHEEARR